MDLRPFGPDKLTVALRSSWVAGTAWRDLRSASEMKSSSCFVLLGMLLSGCDQLPRDIEGTTERVRQERQFRVGLVSDHQQPGDRQKAFVRGVAEATSARPVVERGAAEPLLTRLEEGSLDLVVGRMATKSPWRSKVHFLPELEGKESAKRPVALSAMARNGESEWVALLHREAEEVAAAP